MIRWLKVKNLNKRMSFELHFNEDINVVTGKNGSGKTTVLKLLWYAISGNLYQLVHEISVDSFEIKTDTLTLSMTAESKKSNTIRGGALWNGSVEWKNGESENFVWNQYQVGPGLATRLNDLQRRIARESGSSVFFPTFRRIEGGFSIAGRNYDELIDTDEVVRIITRHSNLYDESRGLPLGMKELADRLSIANHTFVAAISTNDITRLVTNKYAELSEMSNANLMKLAKSIQERVVGGDDPADGEVLETIRKLAKSATQMSDQQMRPFTSLKDLVAKIFQYKGIRFGRPVTFGDTKNAIGSDLLSAGEKQMLSFLCYNAFTNNGCMFIDEPETSLHVDWQRQLFPILQDQTAGNQFIVATHSPFIYAKYADKELVLADKGETDAYPIA